MQFWLGMGLTALMGVSLGLLGGGGSILAVPILVYIFGVEPHAAIAMSLALVGSTAFAAAGLHQRAGQVDAKAGVLFAACAAPVSLLGAKAAMLLPGALLLFFFGLLMVAAGGAMWRRRNDAADAPGRREIWKVVACGALVGFLTGFLGVGGGFLIVPAMALFLGQPMKTAIGTSLLVIGLNCAIALWGHRAALHMNWGILLPSVAAALAGMAGGVGLGKKFDGSRLRAMFALLVVALGIAMAAQNAGALGLP
jgi:hypothetical protein